MQYTRFVPAGLVLVSIAIGSACARPAPEPAAAPQVVIDAPAEPIGAGAAPTTSLASPSPAASDAPGSDDPGPDAPGSADPETPDPETPAAEPVTSTDTTSPAVPESHEPVIVADQLVEPQPGPGAGPDRPSALTLGASCGAVEPIPATAGSFSTIVVDAVGDGVADDTATAFVDEGDWAIQLSTGGGVVSRYDVSGVGPGFVETLGAVQLDGEPGDQFLAVVGSSASHLRIGAFGVDASGCIVRLGGGDGGTIEFPVGGTAGGLAGLACGTWQGAGYVESLSAVDMGGGVFNVYGTTWHRSGADALEAADGTHLFGQSVDDVQWVAALDCPGIDL